MPVTEAQVTKDQFRGDILQRDYSAHYDPFTQTYTFDYVKDSPDLQKALSTIEYVRVTSKDIADVKQAISDYITKKGPRASTPKGEKKPTKEEYEAAKAEVETLEKKPKSQPLTPDEEKRLQKLLTTISEYESRNNTSDVGSEYDNLPNTVSESGLETKPGTGPGSTAGTGPVTPPGSTAGTGPSSTAGTGPSSTAGTPPGSTAGIGSNSTVVSVPESIETNSLASKKGGKRKTRKAKKPTKHKSRKH